MFERYDEQKILLAKCDLRTDESENTEFAKIRLYLGLA